MTFIINDTITKMYQILDERRTFMQILDGINEEFNSIKFELKRNVIDIAICVFREYCSYYYMDRIDRCEEVLKKEFVSTLNMNISDDELKYLINRTKSFEKKVPEFLMMAIDKENEIYYEKNYKCNICLPLVMGILDMIKKIMIEYYFKDEEEVFFGIDYDRYEDLDVGEYALDVENYVLYLLNYVSKNLITMENTVRFLLREQEVAAPEKGK